MSSHHIVREKQEPALIVDSLSGFDAELLGQLLEWSPTIIANKESAQHLLREDIHIDLIISDEHNGIQQDQVSVLYADKASFKETALNYLIEKKYQAANLVSQDHSLQLLQRFAPFINIVLINGSQRMFAIKSGFKKWKAANQKVYIFDDQTNFQVKGLKRESHVCYTTVGDGFFEIYFEKDFLIIGESL
ncbi:hypothetical protein [Olivibacter sp. XZL3]|uniref:hypothetical protein n=1 Tax=Olivibacter sp. XZL3 TaxID=1735116 RepID=UPI0010648D3D|nr:hypothetical protein [Olivibacter sp. XZL3]